MKIRLFAIICFVITSLVDSSAALSNKRVALVIGNSSYLHESKLKNPGNDARLMAEKFLQNGFNVTFASNVSYREMRKLLREFRQLSRNADIAALYYSGHGLEVNNKNYLIPVDARLRIDDDLEYESVTLEEVIRSVREVKKLGLIILDACRNNPFLDKMVRGTRSAEFKGKKKKLLGIPRGVSQGFAPIAVTDRNILIAYASRAGTLAYDGDGANSPYTKALAKHLFRPGLDIRIAFGRIRDEVRSLTNGRQVPWIYGSLGGEIASLVAPSKLLENKTVTCTSGDQTAYNIAKRENTVLSYNLYLEKFPDGCFKDIVEVNIANLKDNTPPPKEQCWKIPKIGNRNSNNIIITNDNGKGKFLRSLPLKRVYLNNDQLRPGTIIGQHPKPTDCLQASAELEIPSEVTLYVSSCSKNYTWREDSCKKLRAFPRIRRMKFDPKTSQLTVVDITGKVRVLKLNNQALNFTQQFSSKLMRLYKLNAAEEKDVLENRQQCLPFFDNINNPVSIKVGGNVDITPPPPNLNRFDNNLVNICGPAGKTVSRQEFKHLMRLHSEILQRIRSFTNNQVFDNRPKPPTLEAYLEDLTDAWFSLNAFSHIFCGKPSSSPAGGGIGGLYFYARYIQLQKKGEACRIPNFAHNEVLPGVIYTIGVSMKNSRGGLSVNPTKGYGITLSGEDILKAATLAFQQNPTTSSKSRACILPIKDDGNSFMTVFIRRAQGIRTFYPDATPSAREVNCSKSIELQ